MNNFYHLPSTPSPNNFWLRDGKGGYTGACRDCGSQVPAIHLIFVPDRNIFGRLKEGGWCCEHCQPRLFGRVGGKPPSALTGYVRKELMKDEVIKARIEELMKKDNS